MNYDFTGKSIKCDTWEQMEHLAKLAEEQGYVRAGHLNKEMFNNGFAYLTLVLYNKYLIVDRVCDPIEIRYSDFINTLPTETIEVTGCGNCPFHALRGESERNYCSIEQKYETNNPLFITCPLKTKSITIKLKNNDTQTKETR